MRKLAIQRTVNLELERIFCLFVNHLAAFYTKSFYFVHMQ
ncbi:hypothetical protein CAter282_4641 [Collimonas arenae]|uniref:Uncharacterized protein n=1 Tax=Collimonas arenae TaxID=279058 RepID=A0A127QQG4_9BURK|nr:hypothetical protein CAter10_5046 [Collimonas arenae]AMP12296.1 hypothetical protein CAter282_4641 [Collimonas arenae]